MIYAMMALSATILLTAHLYCFRIVFRYYVSTDDLSFQQNSVHINCIIALKVKVNKSIIQSFLSNALAETKAIKFPCLLPQKCISRVTSQIHRVSYP